MVSGDPGNLARRLAPLAAVAGAALLVRGCLALTADVAAAAAVGLVVVTPPVAVWTLHTRSDRSDAALVRIAAATAPAVLALVVAAWGLVVTVQGGIGGALATIALAVVLCVVVRRWRRNPGTPRCRPATRSVPLAELCRQWRESCVHLRRARDPAELDLVTALRAAYLDEFERRDPEGFRSWTRQDTAGRSDPARWLREERADDAAG
jgi:hypothetical protein